MERFDDLVSILKSKFESYSPTDGEKRLRAICFTGVDMFTYCDKEIVNKLRRHLPHDAKIVRSQEIPTTHKAFQVVYYSSRWDPQDDSRTFPSYEYNWLPYWKELNKSDNSG
jgi:hypothetical protein